MLEMNVSSVKFSIKTESQKPTLSLILVIYNVRFVRSQHSIYTLFCNSSFKFNEIFSSRKQRTVAIMLTWALKYNEQNTHMIVARTKRLKL